MGPVVNILAIETVTMSCAVGLSINGKHSIRILDTDRHHTEALMPGIVELLADHGLALGELDRIVVDQGPGQFTGMRVGLATAEALSHAVGAPLVGVTSTELHAQQLWFEGHRGAALAIIDARRSELFVEVFTLSNEGVTSTSGPEVRTARDLLIEWGTNGIPAVITGDGVTAEFTTLSAVPNFTVVAHDVPSLGAALRLGETREPGPVSALYLRDADAVANFTVRTRANS